MSGREQPNTPKENLRLQKDALLLLKHPISKCFNTVGIQNPPDKISFEESQKIVNAAYDAFENNSTWSNPYSDQFEISIIGRDPSGNIKRSNKIKAGTPGKFLNKVFSFLFEDKNFKIDIPKPAVAQAESINDLDIQTLRRQLFMEQEKTAEPKIKRLATILNEKGISIDLGKFNVNEHISALLNIHEILLMLSIRVQKNSLDAILNQQKKIKLSFISKPFGTPDQIEITTDSGNKYTTEIKSGSISQTIDLLVKNINGGAL